VEKAGIYTKKATLIASFLGGPLVGGYLISKNFKILGEDEKSRTAIFAGIIFFVIFFELIFLIPDPIFDKIPNSLLPSIYTLIIYYLYKRHLEVKVNEYLNEDGPKASGWKIFGISIIGLILTIAYIGVRVSFMPLYEGEVMEFGEMRNQIYYDDDISKYDVNKLGEALAEFGYFEDNYKQIVQFRVEDDTYELLLFIDKQWWSDEKILQSLNYFEGHLTENVFPIPVRIVMIEEGWTKDYEIYISAALKNLKSP
jgi:hypothetical protein